MLADRESKKQEEYMARDSVDVEKLGLQQGELAQVKELDYMYGG